MSDSHHAIRPFRGQYVFGKHVDRIPEGFETVSLADGYELHYERSLPVSWEQNKTRIVALIGYAFNHIHPEWDQKRILSDLLQHAHEQIPAGTSALAGRWSLIYLGADKQFVLGDCCGTLPINYRWFSESTWLSSSSRLLGHCIDNLPPSALSSSLFPSLTGHSGIACPVDLTEYSDVKVLLPNHYLDIRSGTSTRFHPVEWYAELPASMVAEKAAAMLERLVLSASLQSDLAIAATSGFDSRALIGAAARISGLAKRIMYFTFQDDFVTKPGHFDIVNGQKISELLGGASTSKFGRLSHQQQCRGCAEILKRCQPRGLRRGRMLALNRYFTIAWS